MSSTSLIVHTSGVCGGSATIRGTRIRVMDVIQLQEELGYAMRDILLAYPFLQKNQVRAAIRYYKKHLAEIREDIRQDNASGG